jgi:pimeloyl-ACP methyl ester carboxylesterase
MEHLLLLHGAVGAKDQLEPLAITLGERFHVYTLNFSGHGGEPFAGDFSIPRFAGEVAAHCSAHEVTKVSIFGYSMGGYVGLYLAKQNPGLIKKIVTLGTKFQWTEEIAAREVKMLNPGTIEEKVPAFAAQLKKRHTPNDWKEVLEKTKDMLLGLGRQNVLTPEDYATIQTPSLLLWGEKDKMVTLEETKAVQEALPVGRFHAMPATPHPIEQVDKEQLSKIIVEFLEE